MSKSEPPLPKEDVVFLHSPSQDGEGFRVLRKREDAIEVGELRGVKEGRPIQGEVVKLKQRAESDRLYDVEVVMPKAEAPAAEGAKKSGPAQVATEAYRENWEMIFGKPSRGELPN
jgi:hypothetical protein